MRGTKAKLIRNTVYGTADFRDRKYQEIPLRNFKFEVKGGEPEVKGLLEKGFKVVKEMVSGAFSDIAYYTATKIVADETRAQYQKVKSYFKGLPWRRKQAFT